MHTAQPTVKLYEISAIVSFRAVVAAVSKEDALGHVSTWEQAWIDPANADLVGVSDVELFDVRDAISIKDDAHHVTLAAAAITKAEDRT
jgi:hypothetical protein